MTEPAKIEEQEERRTSWFTCYLCHVPFTRENLMKKVRAKNREFSHALDVHADCFEALQREFTIELEIES